MPLMKAEIARVAAEAEVAEAADDGSEEAASGSGYVTPHPFMSVFTPVEAALEREHAPFLGVGGLLSAADCRIAAAVLLALILRQFLLWPQGGGSNAVLEEQLSEFGRALPLTAAWFGERMLPHVRSVCHAGQPLFNAVAISVPKKARLLGNETALRTPGATAAT